MTTYGYVRVSTPEQAEDRSSLSDQEARIRLAAEVRGDPVHAVYADPGVSGSVPLTERPGGAALLRVAGRGDTVIIAKLDRMFRSALDAHATAQRLQRAGIDLVIVEFGMSSVTGDGVGKLIFGVLASVAEFERDRIAERVKDGKRGKKQRGGHIGGSAPYGWSVQGAGRDAALVEDPAEQAVLARVREMADAGVSLRQIAHRLGEQGVRSRTGSRFAPQQIHRMLRQQED